MANVHEEHSKIFKAFCDEKRLAIIEMLRSGELCACKLQENFTISQSTLSHHMKVLCDSGVVVSRREGKWTYYSINPQGSKKAFEALEHITMLNNNEQSENPCCQK